MTGFTLTSSTGKIGLENIGYLGSAHSDRTSSFSSVIADWRGKTSGPYLDTAIEAKAMLNLLHTSYSFVEAPEVYVASSSRFSKERMANTQFFIGRKLLSWNQLDSSWLLGVWQPRFRWDYLDPAQVGLFGAFFKTELPWLEVGAFGSPIFIPERGVPIEYRDGVFTSLSPWFMSLPAKARLVPTAKEPTPMVYRLVSPSVSEIINYPGGGAYARLGRKEGPWAQAAFSFKPINQLLIGYDGYYRHNLEKIEADLYPRVAYHALSSLESGLIGEPVSGWVSILHEHPLMDATPAEWRTQELAPALTVGSTLEWSVIGKKPSASTLELSYLREWGGDAPDGGADWMPGMNSFESRYPFKDALRVGFKTPLPGEWGSRVLTKLRILYDIQNEGTIYSTEFTYKHGSAWNLFIGADILGSSRETLKGVNTDFIARYRANDRVHGGVGYAF